MPIKDDKRPGGSGTADPTVRFERDDVDVEQVRGEDDLNSTMMAIDISGLNDGLTKTQVRLEQPAAEAGVREHHAKRRSSFLERVLKKTTTQTLAERYQSYVNVWICEPQVSLPHRLIFWISRLCFAILFLILQILIFKQTWAAWQTGHPAQWYYLGGSLFQLGLVVVSVIFRFSPGWVVAFPLSFLLFTFGSGTVFYHTGDAQFFSVANLPLARLLNAFYIFIFVYTIFVGCVLVAQKLMWRVVVGAFCLLSILPLAYNVLNNVPLEYSLFGYGVFTKLGGFYFQPVDWVLQGTIFFLFILFCVFSLGTSRKLIFVMARGFSRSCALILFFLCLLSLVLLQKNRVPHVLNLLVPARLDVGAVEVEVYGQILKIETVQFRRMGTSDDYARYRFVIKKGKAENEYRLTVSDSFGFPVKHLQKSDLIVFVDEKKLTDFQFQELDGFQEDGAAYRLNIKLEQTAPFISGDFSKRPRTSSEELEFKISHPEKIKRITISSNNENIFDLTNVTGDTIKFPLSYFEEGEVHLTLRATDHLDQEIFKKDWDMTVKQLPRVDLVLPLEGDVYAQILPVVLVPSALPPSPNQQISYFIDEAAVLQSPKLVVCQPLSISNIGEGEHRLTIKVQASAFKDPFVKSVAFVKKTRAPQLSIEQPSLGVFAGRQMDVKYRIDGTSSKTAGIKAFVNGQVFNDFVVANNAFVLPSMRWSRQELVLVLQATLDDGTKISDWAVVNKGVGTLNLKFDQAKLGFLNYKNVALVLDATLSLWDNWHGRDKWQTLKKLVSESEVDAKLKFLNTSVSVFGARKPFYYRDCRDHEILVSAGEYNPAILKKKLSEIQPSGISSLADTLKVFLSSAPDKIFVFTDGFDACRSGVHAFLEPALKKSPQTQVVVFGLGQVDKLAEDDLKKLADMTGGRFYQPDNYDALLSYFLQELALNYKIVAQEQVIQQEALEDKKFSLGAGKYSLKIPVEGQVQEFPFTIQNGMTTTVTVTGEKDDLKVDVKQGKE